jgi:nucleotide-binding universal stress UspA family protein
MPGIIVGIDGSGHSHKALEWAVSEAAVRHAPLTVLTVSQALAGYTEALAGHWDGGSVAYPGDRDLTEKALRAAKEETDSVIEKADEGSRPPSVTVLAVTGLPAEELTAAADGADMLVVGSRGAGGFKRLLLGSVSVHVTHHAHCPVVVIPDSNI